MTDAPICPVPGCGMKMRVRLSTDWFHDETKGWICPRGPEDSREHGLCREVAALKAERAESEERKGRIPALMDEIAALKSANEGLRKLVKANELEGLRGLMEWALEKARDAEAMHRQFETGALNLGLSRAQRIEKLEAALSAALTSEEESRKPCVWEEAATFPTFSWVSRCRGFGFENHMKGKFCPDCGHPVEVREA